MSFIKRLRELFRGPESLNDLRSRYSMDEQIWNSLTDAQLALAWCGASQDTDRGRLLAFMCAQRFWEKNRPKPVFAANCIMPEVRTFTATVPVNLGDCVYVHESQKQTIARRKKLRKK